RGAIVTCRRLLDRWGDSVSEIGAFTGWGGLVYAFGHLGTLWRDPTLLAEAEQMVARLPALIDKDEALDAVGGAAGCIGALLTLYRVTSSTASLAAAIHCAERLVE